jgi:PAS domain S-box-containing protein
MVAAKPRAVSSCSTKPGAGMGTSSLEALPTLRVAQLRAIYDGAPVGLCFLDRNLHYVSINRRLAEMNGIPVADHIGRTGKEMFPEWFPNYEPLLRRALQGEAITGAEVSRPSRRPDQPDMVTMASYQPAWDEAGEVIGVSIAVADITDHKRAQEAIREGEDSQRFISDLNPHVQWVMDNEGNNKLPVGADDGVERGTNPQHGMARRSPSGRCGTHHERVEGSAAHGNPHRFGVSDKER